MTYAKLIPERKAEWLAALRSGEYSQTNLSLRDERGFCCLGVGCDLTPIGQWKESVATGYFNFVLNDNPVDVSSSSWSSPIRDYYFGNSDEEKNVLASIDYLIGLNDAQSKSFNEIAYWIEDNL